MTLKPLESGFVKIMEKEKHAGRFDFEKQGEFSLRNYCFLAYAIV